MLWLRSAVAILLIRDTILVWEAGRSQVCCAVAALTALGLGVGLFTPTLCLVAVLLVVSAWRLWSVDSWPLSFLIVSVLVCMALLGPGAYSVDAMLFGRKKLRIGRSAK